MQGAMALMAKRLLPVHTQHVADMLTIYLFKETAMPVAGPDKVRAVDWSQSGDKKGTYLITFFSSARHLVNANFSSLQPPHHLEMLCSL